MKRQLIVLALLLLAIPASAHSAFPQIECTYYHSTDRIVQLTLTDAQAYHLDPQIETNVPRVVSPDVFIMPGQGIFGSCQIWRDAEAIDYPMTFEQMWTYHLNHLAYERKHSPVPVATP